MHKISLKKKKSKTTNLQEVLLASCFFTAQISTEVGALGLRARRCKVILGTPQDPPGPGPRPLRLYIARSLLLPLAWPTLSSAWVTAAPSVGAQVHAKRGNSLTWADGPLSYNTAGLEYPEACEDPERPPCSVLS